MTFGQIIDFTQSQAFAAAALAVYAHLAHVISGLVRDARLNASVRRGTRRHSRGVALITFWGLMSIGGLLALSRFLVYASCPQGHAPGTAAGGTPCVEGAFLIIPTVAHVLLNSPLFFALSGGIMLARLFGWLLLRGRVMLRPSVVLGLILCFGGLALTVTVTHSPMARPCGIAGCLPFDE